MKQFLILFVLSLLVSPEMEAQKFPICLERAEPERIIRLDRKSQLLGVSKHLRINYHFMLRSNGTGNFTETTDGNGGTVYTGYEIARLTTEWINQSNLYNPPMNLPPGNSTPALNKNFFFVTNGVYFHRDDAYFNYQDLAGFLISNYPLTFGNDHVNVLNIYFTYSPTGGEGGFASSLDPNSKIKYNVNTNYWQKYMADFAQGQNPMAYYFHGVGQQVNHEVAHLLGLLHTVRYGFAPPCPTNCPNLGSSPADPGCDDGCSDTPTAWDIASLSGCTVHPASGWGQASQPYKDNNLMDYSGEAALTPCQLNIIHGAIENGMKSYTACDAVANDLTLCSMDYPLVTHFGQNVSVNPCLGSTVTVAHNAKKAIWFSQSVELTDFEVSSTGEFEIVYHSTCSF
ncbi:MAG TPA: hypothetical protein VFR58_16535 [Flavisolibacter sp.]|nr:hypothetical protein [Flavisolibacter sp.]